MRYRTLPGTDLQLAALTLGCWAIGGEWWGDDADDEAARALIDLAWERGIQSFDTAPLYGRGHADALLADALGPRRHEATIVTKVGVRWDTPGGHPRSDLSPAHVIADAEASLRRLGVDVIPLLLTHWPCEAKTPIEATLAALEGLREAGKVRAYGLCNAGPELVDRALAAAPIAALQTPYSMIRRDFEGALRDRCGAIDGEGRWRQRLGVLAYEPLARGLLSGKFEGAPPRFPESDLRARDPRFAEPIWSRLQPLCEALRRVGAAIGAPPAALALAWVLRQPGVSVALVGAKRPAQLAESLRALDLLERQRPFDALAPFVAAARP
ncbi:MAG: aldo/keto reductase [Myxococcales bacterium]|nr:aldo/keto reductase [Myxococcales bacterium]